jgi:hypothetical protein
VVFWDVTLYSLIGGYKTTWCHDPENYSLNKTRPSLVATQLSIQEGVEVISPGGTHSMKPTTDLHLLPKFTMHDFFTFTPLSLFDGVVLHTRTYYFTSVIFNHDVAEISALEYYFTY